MRPLARLLAHAVDAQFIVLSADADFTPVLRKLRRENAELKRANAILKAASVFFAAELDRPSQ